MFQGCEIRVFESRPNAPPLHHKCSRRRRYESNEDSYPIVPIDSDQSSELCNSPNTEEPGEVGDPNQSEPESVEEPGESEEPEPKPESIEESEHDPVITPSGERGHDPVIIQPSIKPLISSLTPSYTLFDGRDPRVDFNLISQVERAGRLHVVCLKIAEVEGVLYRLRMEKDSLLSSLLN
jgi:hypothetical protein